MSNDDTITWREMLVSTTEIVGDRVIAKWLCENAAGVDGDEWLDIVDDKVTQHCGMHIDSMMRRYLAGEPLQYVLGRWAFRHLDLMVDQRVLIPRPETEQLVDLVLGVVRSAQSQELRIADLGTGTGAIGLSLLHELPLGSARVWLTDASVDAADVARANLAGLGRAAIYGQISVGSWYNALPEKLRGSLNVIASNPPYIDHDDQEVEDKVRDWEPHLALFAEENGLAALRVIVFGAATWLRKGGILALEIGHRQSQAVSQLCSDAGLTNVEIHLDAAHRERFITARAGFDE